MPSTFNFSSAVSTSSGPTATELDQLRTELQTWKEHFEELESKGARAIEDLSLQVKLLQDTLKTAVQENLMLKESNHSLMNKQHALEQTITQLKEENRKFHHDLIGRMTKIETFLNSNVPSKEPLKMDAPSSQSSNAPTAPASLPVNGKTTAPVIAVPKTYAMPIPTPSTRNQMHTTLEEEVKLIHDVSDLRNWVVSKMESSEYDVLSMPCLEDGLSHSTFESLYNIKR